MRKNTTKEYPRRYDIHSLYRIRSYELLVETRALVGACEEEVRV